MNDQEKIKLKNRLHRLEGQVRGIESMADQGRSTDEIVQQLWAARQALTSLVVSLIDTSNKKELLLKLIKKI